MPLESMKLVLNDDLSALNEDASHVLNLNERLTRYALYASQLERSNKELGATVETQMTQIAAGKAEYAEAQEAFGQERAGLVGQVAMAEAQTSDALAKVEVAKAETGQAQEKAKAAVAAKESVTSQLKANEKAAEQLREVLTANGIEVPKHLTAQAMAAAGKREAFAAAHGAEAELMLRAAVENSDSARVALRVNALMSKGIDPPVDEAVMGEMLSENLSTEEMGELRWKTRKIALESCVTYRVSPEPALTRAGESRAGSQDTMATLEKLKASTLSSKELTALEASARAREVGMLAGYGVMPPVDPTKMAEALKVSLQAGELTALRASDTEARREKLEGKGVALSAAATPSEVDAALKANLSDAELEALEATVQAGHVNALAERGIAPLIDLPSLKRILAQTLTPNELMKVQDEAIVDTIAMLLQKDVPQGKVVIAADDDKLLQILKAALSPQDYEAVSGSIRHEKMTALAAKGKQVPVDEVKLLQLLEEQLSPAELATLRSAEQESAYNSARAAVRLEKLLEKGVPMSDDLIVACQRGEPWAIAELDKLTRQNLSEVEMQELLAQEEAVLSTIFEGDGDGEMSAGGGGGGSGNAKVGSSVSKGASMASTTITREEAALQSQSMLLDVQNKMESDYLSRLAESSAALRATLQADLDKEQQARREAQARNLALLDAVENQRARNAELMAKLAEHEARELERLRQLETMQSSRELELDSFRLQAERAIQDAAEAKAAREQLERAINQYEKILDAIGISRSVDKMSSQAAMTTRTPKPAAEMLTATDMAATAADGPGVSFANPASFGAGVGQRGQSVLMDMDSAASYGGGGGGGAAAAGMAASAGPGAMVMTPAMQQQAAAMGMTPQQVAAMTPQQAAAMGLTPGLVPHPGGPIPPGMPPAGMAGGVMSAGGGLVLGAESMGITIASALPPHLLQLEKFILLTDEGPVAVRARYNGTIGYLKRQIANQLHISPRLALTVTASSSTIALNDDAIIAPYAEGQGGERLLLSAAPRPLSDFFLALLAFQRSDRFVSGRWCAACRKTSRRSSRASARRRRSPSSSTRLRRTTRCYRRSRARSRRPWHCTFRRCSSPPMCCSAGRASRC